MASPHGPSRPSRDTRRDSPFRSRRLRRWTLRASPESLSSRPAAVELRRTPRDEFVGRAAPRSVAPVCVMSQYPGSSHLTIQHELSGRARTGQTYPVRTDATPRGLSPHRRASGCRLCLRETPSTEDSERTLCPAVRSTGVTESVVAVFGRTSLFANFCFCTQNVLLTVALVVIYQWKPSCSSSSPGSSPR